MVNFINTAPIYETWKQTVHRPEWRVTEAPPSELNRLLSQGELDLGFVSSHEYGADPAKYQILGDLSISATGAVGSVFLFSKHRPEELSGKTVYLSPLSQTSNSLIKIILEEFYQVRPNYAVSNFQAKPAASETALLAIGDRALRLLEDDCFPIVLDLSQIWQQHTGLPFVFAVWAVRQEFCLKQAGCIAEIHGELLRCLRQGKENLPAICELVAPRIPMEVGQCQTYLSNMEYDLGPQKVKALELFYQYLIKRGEARPEALPLKIVSI